MRSWVLTTLYRLAEITLNSGTLQTTIDIANKLGLSQQTASRQLIELEKEGLIRRERLMRGTSIRITDKGMRELRRMHVTLHRVLEKPRRQLTLEGELFTGLGEGAYYVSQSEFLTRFKEKMGFKPFVGTLNLRLKDQQLRNRSHLESMSFTEIDGFRNGRRSFGSVKCYPAVINGEIEGCVIRPGRTHYGEEVIEVLAAVNLRKRLKLRDGDIVKVSFPI